MDLYPSMMTEQPTSWARVSGSTSQMAILIARFYMRHSMRGVTTAPEIVRWNATDVHVITDQGEIMMCKDSNTFLKRIEQGDEIDE